LRLRALALWAMLGLASVTMGCNAARLFVVSPGDYADYRRVRLAETADERMAAAWSYLQDRPDGAYAERLQRYFDKAEPAFYDLRRRSAAGLESYLGALPEGPHSEEALATLMDVRGDARRVAASTQAARATGARLARDNAARERAADAVDWWLRTLLDRDLHQRPFDQGPSELLVRYRLALPAAICGGHLEFPAGQQCVKPFTHPFVVLGEDGREERELAYEVEIELDDRWRLHRAIITGGFLFATTEEARQGRALGELEDAQVAELARDYLAALPKNLTAHDILCAGGEQPDGRFRFDCEDATAIVTPGAGGGADRIEILATSAAASPDQGAEGVEEAGADDDEEDGEGEQTGDGGGAVD
jgi:hypothetical protein